MREVSILKFQESDIYNFGMVPTCLQTSDYLKRILYINWY